MTNQSRDLRRMSQQRDAASLQDFSLKRTLSLLSNGGISPREWIFEFLEKNTNPNLGLIKYLESHPRKWSNPIPLDLDIFNITAGPGRRHHEDEKRWNARIDRIVNTLKNLENLPPAISLVKKNDDNNFNIVVADGAHRHSALKRMGASKMWTFLGFDNDEVKSDFLRRYESDETGAEMATELEINKEEISMTEEKLHKHYYKDYAENYEKIREKQPHWHTEHQAIERLMEPLRGSKVLDVPVGTGRFIPIYKALGCHLVGSDISTDMLEQSRLKADRLNFEDIELIHGNAAETKFPEVDVALCMRFINLVPKETAREVILNLGAAAKSQMLIHLASIDLDQVSEKQRPRVKESMANAYAEQKEKMRHVSHLWSDFVDWVKKAGFSVFESIECQERHGNTRVHVHRLVKNT